MHLVLLHPRLDITDGTERLIATVTAAVAAGHRVSVLGARGPRAACVERAGAEVFSAELPTDGVLGYFAERRTSALLAELAPDLLQATEDSLAALVARLAERRQVPYLLEVMRPVTSTRLQQTRWMRGIIVPCETFVETAVNRGGASRSLIHCIPHGPRLDRPWSPRPLAEVELPVIASLGTLDELHGTEVFLEAAKRLKKAGRALRYLVLGEGPNEEALRRRVREHDLGEVVTIAAPSIPNWSSVLAEIDLHVSCISAGSPGWCAVHALGLGIPSIFSAVNSTFALVEDRKSGLLVERNRSDKLAEQLAVFLDNPHAARRMGDVARQSMRQREVAAPYATALAKVHEQVFEPSRS